MASESRQLRGWKEIAAHLHASERTVKRWETSRHLPIHRVGGNGRDAVFAFVEELDGWLARGGSVSTDVEKLLLSGDPTTRPPAETGRQNSLLGRRRPILFACLVALGLLAVFIGPRLVRRDLTRPPAARPQATQSTHRLRFSVRGWTTTVGIPDGKCATVQLSADVAPVFCAAADRRAVLVRVSRPAGNPAEQKAPRPFTLHLQRDTEVRVLDPVPFDLEWVGTQPASELPEEK